MHGIGANLFKKICQKSFKIFGASFTGVSLPTAVFACALPPSVILTLPTGHYIAGAAATVFLTAILALRTNIVPEFKTHNLGTLPFALPVTLTSYLSFLVFLALVLVGFFGARDPMHNLLTLVFWTGVWVALPILSVFCGNLWRVVNPWTGPVRLTRNLLGYGGSVGLAKLASWPAVLSLAAFAWFQMVSLSPDDPLVLATIALVYWLAIFVAAVLEGEDWLERGEFLTVLMTFLSRVAPLWHQAQGGKVRLFAGFPGSQIAALAPLQRSEIAFVIIAVASLSFDGLNETFWWQGLIGENPLEPTGRSAVLLANTVGLALAWVISFVLILGAIRVGKILGGERFRAGQVALSFLAIAAGYHFAHYLVTLLTTGQYTLAALNDPLFRGDSLLGLPAFYVSFGFLTDSWAMSLIYMAQFSAILGAHLLAILLTMRLTGEKTSWAAHLPMTALMVGYTVFGLWLLSTARSG